jgi:hypothetical protein
MSLAEMALLVVFFVPAIQSQRMILWWGLLLPVALARPAASVWNRYVQTRRDVTAPLGERNERKRHAATGFDWAMASLLLLMLAASTPWTRAINPLLPSAKSGSRPAEEPWHLAIQLAKTTATPVRSHTPLRWAPYFTWHTRGNIKSFVDSRVDFFPDPIWNDYQQIARGLTSALALLDRYAVDLVVCDRRHAQLAATLGADPRWQLDYQDPHAQAFRRTAERLNTQPAPSPPPP